MKRILSTLTLLLCFAFTAVNAQVITVERAAEIANSFFSAGAQKSGAARGVVASSGLTANFDSNDVTDAASANPTFYVLTNPEGGFVIVSGEETENPIIGYSFDGTIDTSNLPDGFVDYMTDIDAQVKALREYNANNPQKAAARNAMARAADYEYNATSMGNIVKNLNTAPWGQRTPFNKLCPVVGTGNAVTGCVPTAYSILCRYYEWPEQGVGTVYNPSTGDPLQLGHTYDYASMRNDNYPSGYTDAEATAVATLMRDMGYAYTATYGSGTTTTSSENPSNLIKYFGFKCETPLDHGNGCTKYDIVNNMEQWVTYIKNCLNAGYPIPYSSTTALDAQDRHIYILDGYTDNNYFHFNWGWFGSGNGWFTLDNMVPDDYSNYSKSHRAYFNVIPDKTTYTVTATVNDSNMGTVSINGGTAGSTATANLISGATATLTAHPLQDYALANWTKGGVVVGSRNTIEVTVGTDANDYVANFDDAANVLVVKEYTVNPANGSLSGGTSKYSTWTSTDTQPALTLKATNASGAAVYAISALVSSYKAYATAYDSSDNAHTNITYTLSVPEGYVITNYLMTYNVGTAGQISLNGELLNATGDHTLSAAPNAQTASFTLSVPSAGQQYITVKSIAVTVQSEGGGSTPTPDPDPEPEPDPTPTTYAVTTTANPAAGGTAKFAVGTGSQKTQGDVENGTQITLYATANTGYNFVNWTLGGNVVSTDATCNVNVAQAANYVANFEENATPTPTEYPTPTGATYTNNYLTSVTTTGANENISYTADAHPNKTLVTLPGTVRVEQGKSFTLNLVAKSLSSSTSSVYEDMRYCHASLFTDFDGDRTFGTAVQTWGNQPPTNNVAGNYSSVMNITHEITVPAEAPLGTSHVRMIYTNAWKGWPTDGTAVLDKGIVYDIVVEVVEPSNEETLNVTFAGATWGNASGGFYDYVTTNTSPVVTVRTAGGGKAIGYSTINTVKHPYLLDGNSFTISIPAPYKIIGYTLTYKGHQLNTKTFTYTGNNGTTATETVGQDGVEKSLTVTGLENSAIEISVSDQSSQAGVIITALEITYVEDETATTYTVAVSAGENGTAKASAATVVEGDNVTLTATPNPNYKFVGWYNGETKVSDANPYTFAVTSDINYEARFEVFPDGAYKIYWKADNRGYLAYHGTDYSNEAKLAGVTYSGCQNLHYGINDADLVWYLITASDGKRYLFEVATGKFLGVNTSVYDNGQANKLSTTEAWPIAVEPNTNSTRLGHYIITTMISGTKNLLCSGCGTPKEQHPVRWLVVNDNNQKDGGAPLQLEKVDDVTVADDVMSAVRAVIEPRTFKFQAEIDGWRNDNPNTHLGTITIGGTAVKLTPEHLNASELTMPLAEGTALEFTRKYRGFEFNGFYIGATSLGTNPTLTADNVDAIDENNPLVAKFIATDDVTLFYDDDEFSYRIPAIAKTGTNRLVAISDYRHSHDDIGRDNHHTGTLRVDLVMRTSDDNGLTWSAKQTIAEGTSTFGYGDAAVVANGENILVMAVAGNVFFTNANANNKQRTYRIYSSDNGATWNKEEVSNNLYTLFPNGYGMFFGSGKLVVDPNFNNSGNARVYGAVLLNDGNNYVVYSDNWGSTWNILGGGAAASANEPKVEILPNGQILLSARRNGGRTFNVFTYTDKANNAGTWSTAINGCGNGGNGTNGEIICLDAKRPNGTRTKILLQSQPNGSDRRDVSIWYKEISANETYTASSIASDWTMGKQVSTQLSAYSAMCLQENGEIALFFEEAPCHNDDHTYGYSMVYVPLTIEEITNNAFLNPNAVVDPTTVDVTLTDGEGNTYTHQFDYLPGDAAAIDAALKAAYPFITLGENGNLEQTGEKAYTYTNTVTLPFKVSNANTTVWHNIYWPANTNENLWPIYMLANTATDTQVAKVNTSTQYGNSQYNTLEYADKLSWAIYSVDGTLNFKLKNKVTQKYIQVTSVGTGNEKNAVYAEEEATAFTLEEGTGSRENSYTLIAKVDGAIGYFCSTSTDNSWATHYNGPAGKDHHGAWVKFVEAPDYQAIVDALTANVDKFGAGDGNYTDNNDIDAIKAIIENIANTPLNTLNTHTETVQTVKDSYREVVLTVNDDETATVPGTISITVNGSTAETVNNKFVPANATVSILATANPGYRFVNWTRPAAQASAAARTAEARNSNVVSDQNPYTVTVSEALSLEANFEQIVVDVTLTDAQSNTYEVQVSGFTTEITKDAVADKLREVYPYITLGTTDANGNVIDNGVLNINGTAYIYTNNVELPFKVSSVSDYWHNIYYPSNSKTHSGYPNYIAAFNDEDDIVDMAESPDYAYGDNPTYNTKAGNLMISWAVYSVNNSFEFVFKNELTNKYIKVESVVNATGNTKNVKFVDNAGDATAFTLLEDAGSYNGDYALVANVEGTTGYLCATSSSTNYVTHFDRNDHQGAWVKFEEVDYGQYIGVLDTKLRKFDVGDGKYMITDEIQEMINALVDDYGENITKSQFEAYFEAIDAMDTENWPMISLTINPVEGGTTNINGEENVVRKYVPNGYELPLAAIPAEGYHFVSWTDGTSEVSTVANYTFNITAATELTANFAKNSYTVSVTAGEGGSASASAATVEHGGEVTLTAVENDGYDFAGWYNGEEFVSAEATYTVTNVTSDINYTARFEEEADTPVTYTVSIETEGLSNDKFAAFIYTGITQDETQKSYELGSPVKLIAVQDNNDVGSSGYAFVGWFLGETLVSENDEFDFNVTGNVTYKAKFVEGIRVSVRAERGWPSIYLLNSDKEVGGTSMSTLLVPGRQLKLSVNPEFGCRFVRWTVGEEVVSTDNPYITEPLNEAVIFRAICEPASYNLTVRANYDERGTVSATSGASTGTTIQVGHNMEATITAEPAKGYRFVEWTKGTDVVSTSATYTIAGIENVEDMLNAEYVAVFEVEESVNPNVGTYYRIAYDFEVPVAAKSAATRAVGEQTITLLTTGELGGIKSNSKNSEWNSDYLSMHATGGDGSNPVYAIYKSGTSYFRLFGYTNDANSNTYNNIKYTLSAKEGYVITSCSFSYTQKIAGAVTITYNGASENSNDASSHDWAITPNAQTVEITLSTTTNNSSNYLTVKNFTVTIQPVGGESEGGGETPEPEPETVRYYVQSEACRVSGKENALLMTPETGAASIFYYADNKLMSYKTGTFVKENSEGARGLQAIGVENGGDVTITTNGNTSTIAVTSYMHANKTNDGSVKFVDHCGLTSSCDEHNFVLEEVTSLPVTISSVGYATWYAPVAVELPDEVTAYTITINGDYAVTGDGFKTVPAKTGVILAGAPGTYNLEIVTTNEVVESIMEGTVAAEYLENESAYVLSNKGSLGLGFYMAADGNASYSHKAYLPKSALAPAAQMRSGFRLMLPGVTAIEEVETENVETIYDLTGRKLEGISGTGIYIINGKKVLIK